MEFVVPPLTDPGEVGIRPENVRETLCCVNAGDTYPWVGYLGGDPPHGADPGGVPPPGGAENHRESPKATAVWGLAVPPDIGDSNGGGDGGAVVIHRTEAEHSGTVNFHLAHHGPLPRIGEAPGGKGQ